MTREPGPEYGCRPAIDELSASHARQWLARNPQPADIEIRVVAESSDLRQVLQVNPDQSGLTRHETAKRFRVKDSALGRPCAGQKGVRWKLQRLAEVAGIRVAAGAELIAGGRMPTASRPTEFPPVGRTISATLGEKNETRPPRQPGQVANRDERCRSKDGAVSDGTMSR